MIQGKLFSSEAFSYLQVPLKVAFYLFTCPINVNVDNWKEGLTFKTSFPRKIWCGILQGAVLLFYLTRIIIVFNKPINNNPVALYDIATSLFEFLFGLCWTRACWNSRGIRNLMKTSYNHVVTKPHKSFSKRRILLFSFCWLNTLGRFLVFVIPDYGIGSNFFEASWLKLKKAARPVRQVLELSSTINEEEVSDEDMSVPMVMASFVYDFSRLYSYHAVNSAVNFLSILSYLSYQISKEYFEFLTKQKLSFKEIQQSYQEVSTLIQSFNEAFSELCLIQILWFIPFFTKHSTSVVEGGKWREGTIILVHGIYAAWILIFSAMANEAFRKLVDYVCENEGRLVKEGVQKCELTLLVIKLKSSVKTIGLGGSKFFIIDFNFIGTLVGTWITFLMIVMQFKSNDTTST